MTQNKPRMLTTSQILTEKNWMSIYMEYAQSQHSLGIQAHASGNSELALKALGAANTLYYGAIEKRNSEKRDLETWENMIVGSIGKKIAEVDSLVEHIEKAQEPTI